MDIEKVRVLTVLKCGVNIYKKGQIYSEPIPNDLIVEVRDNTGTVEVLSRRTSPVPDKIKQEEKSLDTTPKEPEPEPEKELEPEPEKEPDPEPEKEPESESLESIIVGPAVDKMAETVKDEKVKKPEKSKQVTKKRPRVPQKRKKVVRGK